MQHKQYFISTKRWILKIPIVTNQGFGHSGGFFYQTKETNKTFPSFNLHIFLKLAIWIKSNRHDTSLIALNIFQNCRLLKASQKYRLISLEKKSKGSIFYTKMPLGNILVCNQYGFQTILRTKSDFILTP